VEAGLKTTEDIISETFGFIENEILGQKLFFEGLEAYERAYKRVVELKLPAEEGGRIPVLLAVHSDHSEILGAACHTFLKNQRYRMKAIVKTNSKGQFVIVPKYGADLTEVVAVLRSRLASKRGIDVDPELLRSEANVKGVPEIYFHKEAGSIFNGARTQPDTPGLIGKWFTKDELIGLIAETLNKQ